MGSNTSLQTSRPVPAPYPTKPGIPETRTRTRTRTEGRIEHYRSTCREKGKMPLDKCLEEMV